MSLAGDAAPSDSDSESTNDFLAGDFLRFSGTAFVASDGAARETASGALATGLAAAGLAGSCVPAGLAGSLEKQTATSAHGGRTLADEAERGF